MSLYFIIIDDPIKDITLLYTIMISKAWPRLSLLPGGRVLTTTPTITTVRAAPAVTAPMWCCSQPRCTQRGMGLTTMGLVSAGFSGRLLSHFFNHRGSKQWLLNTFYALIQKSGICVTVIEMTVQNPDFPRHGAPGS